MLRLILTEITNPPTYFVYITVCVGVDALPHALKIFVRPPVLVSVRVSVDTNANSLAFRVVADIHISVGERIDTFTVHLVVCELALVRVTVIVPVHHAALDLIIDPRPRTNIAVRIEESSSTMLAKMTPHPIEYGAAFVSVDPFSMTLAVESFSRIPYVDGSYTTFQHIHESLDNNRITYDG